MNFEDKNPLIIALKGSFSGVASPSMESSKNGFMRLVRKNNHRPAVINRPIIAIEIPFIPIKLSVTARNAPPHAFPKKMEELKRL